MKIGIDKKMHNSKEVFILSKETLQIHIGKGGECGGDDKRGKCFEVINEPVHFKVNRNVDCRGRVFEGKTTFIIQLFEFEFD